MHPIDQLAQEHETLAKITASLANGEQSEALRELEGLRQRLQIVEVLILEER